MNSEELERAMEFIIDQQAQSTAKIGVLEDIVTRLGNATLRKFDTVEEKSRDVDERISALVDSQIRLTESQTRTDKRLDDVDGKLNALVDSQIRLTESQERTDENLRLTNETLRTLISLVDRYLSGNGRAGSKTDEKS